MVLFALKIYLLYICYAWRRNIRAKLNNGQFNDGQWSQRTVLLTEVNSAGRAATFMTKPEKEWWMKALHMAWEYVRSV